MCEPVSMIMMGLTAASAVGSMVMGKQAKATPPPAAKVPERAIEAPVSRNPAAVVRLGTNKQDETGGAGDARVEGGNVQRRVSGNSLGNLGKTSLI